MLSIFDHLDTLLEAERFRQVPLRHLSSELMAEFGYKDQPELEYALNEAFNLCYTMEIPISLHFKKIYLYENGQLISDWLMSDLGTYLLLINGNTKNPYVAKARLYLLTHTQH